MKKHDASLIKKGILLSLVLLSPEILAATENLNFNYTRADVSSLDPRLSKLGKTCHTLDDPIAILVRFKRDINTQSLHYVMTVEGAPVSKAYARLSSLSSGGKTVSDPDLLVPWGVTLSGKASFNVVENYTEQVTTYVDPFCFSWEMATATHYFPESEGFIPIYRDPPYSTSTATDSSEFVRYCIGDNPLKPRRRNPSNYMDTFWPDYNNPPDIVKNHISSSPNRDDYLFKYIFFRKLTTTPVDKEHWVSKDVTANGSYTEPSARIEFPVYFGNNFAITKEAAGFTVYVNNRNITGLKLEIFLDSRPNAPVTAFTWKKDNSYLNNVLSFVGEHHNGGLRSAGNIPEDPYVKSFYTQNVGHENNYFRGTLVKKYFLNSAYTDYVNNIAPLSLPAKKQGDINLVNTDGLVFEIGQMTRWAADPTITVYGQPLKFGPLHTGNQKEVLSAMQVRNACY